MCHLNIIKCTKCQKESAVGTTVCKKSNSPMYVCLKRLVGVDDYMYDPVSGYDHPILNLRKVMEVVMTSGRCPQCAFQSMEASSSPSTASR